MPRKHIGEPELQLQSSLTMALDGGEWSASHPNTLPLRKVTSDPTKEEAGCTPEQEWVFWKRNNILLLLRFELQTIQTTVKSQYKLRYPG
jgi:hypothetical protein